MNNLMAYLYVGTEQDKDGRELDMSGGDILKALMSRVTREFGGCTGIESFGAFTHQDGRVVVEQAVIVSTLIGSGDSVVEDLNKSRIERIARDMAEMLKQESVLVTFAPVDARFVEAA